MEYKRLTIKDQDGNWQVWEDDYSHPFEALQTAIDKLAELEDKIEDGTLINMPRIIHPNKAEWYVQYQYPNGVIQYLICFSEAEAKEILKKLQGE